MDGPDPSAGPALQGAGGDDDHDPGDKTSEAGGELDNDPAPGRFPFTRQESQDRAGGHGHALEDGPAHGGAQLPQSCHGVAVRASRRRTKSTAMTSARAIKAGAGCKIIPDVFGCVP